MGVAHGEALPSGTTLGPYELVELIGSGGFGNVYRARSVKIGNEVAIKVLHAERCTDPANITRFIDEARTVSALKHPGIVEVFDFGVTPDGMHYFVMELLRGRSLAAILDERIRLPFAEAQPLLLDIATIVDAFHAKGASHRDLKPANVMVLSDGGAKVIDFGLAKLSLDVDRTQTREVLGTPMYMAPEQCRGMGSDARSDRYSFGALAYHILTGAPPFVGEAVAVAVAQVERVPQRPSKVNRKLPSAVDVVVLGLLAKDPSARPTSLVAATRAMMRLPVRRITISIAVAVGTVGLAAAAGAFAVTRHRAEMRVPIDPARVHIVRTERASKLSAVGAGAGARSAKGTMTNIQALRPDGSAVDFATTAGMTSIPWNGPSADLLAGGLYRSTLPDGRAVESDASATLVDKDGLKQSLGAASFAETCSDSRHVAMFAGNSLVLYDLATGRSRKLADAPGTWGVRWSPSCDRLVWGNSDGVHLTSVEGKTERLDLDVAQPRSFYTPAAFLDRETLVYCGRAADGTTTLRARYLDHRAPDTVLAGLPPGVMGCSISATPDGRRLVVATFEQTLRVVLRDLESGASRQVMQDPTGTARVLGYIDEGHLLIGTYPPQSMSIAEPPQARARVHPSSMEIYALDGSHERANGCPGSIGMTRFRNLPVHIVLDAEHGPYRLLSTTCEQAAVLPVPTSGPWSLPSCAGETCVAATIQDTQIVLEQLTPVRREIARVPHHQVQRDNANFPIVALSPDSRNVLAVRVGDPLYHVVSIADGSVQTLRPSGDGCVNNLVWADAATYYVMRAAERLVDRVPLTGPRTVFARETASLFQVSSSGATLATSEVDDARRMLFVEIDR